MRGTCVPHKATRCTKLPGAQRSPELDLRSTDFHAPESLIFPALFMFALLLTPKSYYNSLGHNIWINTNVVINVESVGRCVPNYHFQFVVKKVLPIFFANLAIARIWCENLPIENYCLLSDSKNLLLILLLIWNFYIDNIIRKQQFLITKFGQQF